MKERKEEMRELAETMLEKIFNMQLEEAKEKGELTSEKEAIVREKFRLDVEQAKAEKKLDEVTHNNYIEIGVIMNDFRKELIELHKKTYERCKKWLDDNNLPYCNIEDEEDDD